MTREEAIIEAGIEYSIQNSPYCIGGDNFYEKARELNRNKSFEAGVKWADSHPKSPWISVEDDLPCNHEELTDGNVTRPIFVHDKNGKYDVTVMAKFVKWDFIIGGITHWMPIPKLSKE